MACRSNLTRTHAFCENFHVWKLIIMVGCLVAPYVPQFVKNGKILQWKKFWKQYWLTNNSIQQMWILDRQFRRVFTLLTSSYILWGQSKLNAFSQDFFYEKIVIRLD